jgi:hypothetical protein
MWNIDAQYKNCAQWILTHNARVVHVSCWCDEEEMPVDLGARKSILPCDISIHDKYK